jgi:DNA-binding beta-propeller fold protein YncE
MIYRGHGSYPLFLTILVAPSGLLAMAATFSNPRVEYVKTVPSVREFTKPHSAFSKLFNWLVGAADDKPELLRPFATTLDSIGRLLVADPGQHGVHVYDFEKQKYQFLKGTRKQPLDSPIDVACDVNDDIYVSDSMRKSIFVFDKRGRLLRTIGGTDVDSRLERPTGMTLDRAAHRIYVTDTLRHQMLMFTTDGHLIRTIGKRGAGPGEFNFPTAVTISKGVVYVVDAMNFRIQSFTPNGEFLNAFGQLGNQTGSLNRPKGIAADTDGNLYLVDALFETVQVFDPVGRLLYYFGSTGTGPGQFRLPSGIAIDNRNIIYVADSQNRRVQVFRYRRASE